MKTFAKMLKILSLTQNLSHISSVQKLGLRPMALAFLYARLGQKPAQAKGQGPAWPGFFLAWLGPAFGLRPKPAHHYRVPIFGSQNLIFTAIARSIST